MSIYFIIPIYKTEKYLERCVNSVINQTYPDVKIILVDDGNTDNSPEMCDSFAEKNSNIFVIHKSNGGLSDARNHGLDLVDKEAKDDDFITFLDSDDFVRKDYCEKLLSICKDNDCDAVQCGYEKGTADEFSSNTNKIDIIFNDAESMLLNQRTKSMSCSKLYKVSCFRGIRFPVGVWNEDEFTTYRALYRCKRVAITNEELYYYYQHTNSVMKNVATRLKNNPHLFDWFDAYKERIAFFTNEGKNEQVLRTYEKICTDIILRYCEQMYLKKEDRDDALTSGEYIRIYKKYYPLMIKRKGIALKRRLMYILFNIFPYSAVVTSKLFGLRK